MTHTFSEIRPDRLSDNPFKAIGKDAMLITAGTLDSFNTMTANWGAWGYLWHRDVCFCFVRPQRHTFGFIERASHFTLSFFDPAYSQALDFCGSHSGRDTDKIAATGLTPVAGVNGTVYFAEARLVLECRKIYAQYLVPGSFFEPAIPAEMYAKADFHRMYVGEIVRALSGQA